MFIYMRCFVFPAAPKIDPSGLGSREIRVKAGEPLCINMPVNGAPTPTVKWAKDGKDLITSARVSKRIVVRPGVKEHAN